MSDQSVQKFFTKNANDDYSATYRLDHSPRIAALLARYGLVESLKGKRVADFGGGLGFTGELLDPSTDYWVIDGAEIPPSQRVSNGHFITKDLDHDHFGTDMWSQQMTWVGGGVGGFAVRSAPTGAFDAAFCLEVLEHLGNPHHALVEIKKLVKPRGEIFISIPTETVWHNAPYPSLLWPRQNFEMFLAQMALPVIDFYEYTPAVRGWPAYQYRCTNAPWSEKKLVFPKTEEKFRDANPLECTNL